MFMNETDSQVNENIDVACDHRPPKRRGAMAATFPTQALSARQDDLPMSDIMLHHHFDQVPDSTPLIPRV